MTKNGITLKDVSVEHLAYISRKLGRDVTSVANEVLHLELLKEQRAKNEAYYFILMCGHLKQFNDFCEMVDTTNQHEECIDLLTKKL